MGWYSAWPSVEPFAGAAFALGPCRGWGRHPSARIRAQKEPVVSPVGAGTEYRSTRRVSWRLVGTRRQGTRRGNGTYTEQNVCGGRRWTTVTFSSGRGMPDVHTLQKGGACWGASPGSEAGASNVDDARECGEPTMKTGGGTCVPHRGRWRGVPCRTRWERCPCTRDNGCTTRRHRSYRCAGVWSRHRADRPAPRAA